jgi:hypothetical protein
MEYDQWLVTVATEAAGQRIVRAKNSSLEGLVARIDDPAEVVITVGGSQRDQTRLTIEEPRRIAVETRDGEAKSVLIETKSGDVTRVVLVVPPSGRGV